MGGLVEMGGKTQNKKTERTTHRTNQKKHRKRKHIETTHRKSIEKRQRLTE
jgi:hypothetical protein